MNGSAADGRARVMWVLYGAFILAVPIYAFVTYFILMPDAGDEISGIYTFGAAAAGATILCLGMVLPRIIVSKAKITKVQGMTESQQRASLFIVFTGAYLETPAVFGTVGVFLNVHPAVCYGLMAASLAFLLGNIPRIRTVVNVLRRMDSEQTR
jgi:hypothetical protein